MKFTDEQLERLMDPNVLKILNTVLSDPLKGIRTLDILIESEHTPDDSKMRYRALKQSLENYAQESSNPPVSVL